MKQTWAKDRADRASKAKRQVRTSAATIGIILSAGASNLLLTQRSDSAPAAAANQPLFSQMSMATAANLSQTHALQSGASQLGEPSVTKQPTQKTAKVLHALRVNRLIRQLKASKITTSTTALAYRLDAQETAIAKQRLLIDRLKQQTNRWENSSAELGFEEWQAPGISTSGRSQMETSLVGGTGLQPAVSLLAFQPQLQVSNLISSGIAEGAMPYMLETMPGSTPPGSTLMSATQTAAMSRVAIDRPMVLVPVQATYYKVKAGDTLTAIAQQHGLPLKSLIAANQLADPNRIQIAQQVIVPTPSKRIDTQQLAIAALENNTSENNTFAGMGGNISDDDSVVEANPQDVAEIQNQQSAAAEQTQLSSRYVQNLRADIEKLQQRYRSQTLLAQALPGKIPAVKTSGSDRLLRKLRQFAPAQGKASQDINSKQASKTLQIESLKQPQRPAKPNAEDGSGDSLATAPIDRDGTDSLQSIQERNVSPSLPPLGSVDTYLPKPTISRKGFMWPARGKLSSVYGYRWGRMHRGIDIAAPIGTPIFAAAAGVVIKSGWNSGGYGNMVDVEHPDGTITRYAHNKRLLVHKGQLVYQGQQISEMGSTGFSTGPHLHFEVHPLGKKAVNPIAFLPR